VRVIDAVLAEALLKVARVGQLIDQRNDFAHDRCLAEHYHPALTGLTFTPVRSAVRRVFM